MNYWSRLRQIQLQVKKAREAPDSRLFVDTQWSHHIRRSGYHLICEDAGVRFPQDFRLLPALVSRAISKAAINPHWESQFLLRLLIKRGRVKWLHINDGDFLVWPSHPRPGPSSLRVSATFHQPPDRLVQYVGLQRKGEIDVAIAVARCQVDHLTSVFGEENVHFVPHGVDTDYFLPGHFRDPDLVISVGVHRRDFVTLQLAAEHIVSKRPSARVVLIAPSAYLPDGLRNSPLEIRTDISDEDLKTLYSSASCQLLPLEESTANNAILEGMACGVPLVTTKLAGIADYTSDDWCIACQPKDAESHAEAVLAILSDEGARDQMSRAARAFSANFDWPVVRARFRQVFSSCEDGISSPPSKR